MSDPPSNKQPPTDSLQEFLHNVKTAWITVRNQVWRYLIVSCVATLAYLVISTGVHCFVHPDTIRRTSFQMLSYVTNFHNMVAEYVNQYFEWRTIQIPTYEEFVPPHPTTDIWTKCPLQ